MQPRQFVHSVAELSSLVMLKSLNYKYKKKRLSTGDRLFISYPNLYLPVGVGGGHRYRRVSRCKNCQVLVSESVCLVIKGISAIEVLL